MARYRKGNRYLSEQEYREEERNIWIFWLFLIGAAASGYAVNKWISGFDLPKWIRFSVTVLASLVGGSVLGALYKQVQYLIGFSILGIALYYFGLWLWGVV